MSVKLQYYLNNQSCAIRIHVVVCTELSGKSHTGRRGQTGDSRKPRRCNAQHTGPECKRCGFSFCSRHNISHFHHTCATMLACCPPFIGYIYIFMPHFTCPAQCCLVYCCISYNEWIQRAKVDIITECCFVLALVRLLYFGFQRLRLVGCH